MAGITWRGRAWRPTIKRGPKSRTPGPERKMTVKVHTAADTAGHELGCGENSMDLCAPVMYKFDQYLSCRLMQARCVAKEHHNIGSPSLNRRKADGGSMPNYKRKRCRSKTRRRRTVGKRSVLVAPVAWLRFTRAADSPSSALLWLLP